MTGVREWMTDVVRTGSWRTFDDLHIDEIDGNVARDAWVWESLRIAREAALTRDHIAPSFAIVLGFGLGPSTRPIPPEWSSVKGFTDDLDESPPSLYMFERGSEEWRSLLGDTVAFAPPPFLTNCGDVRYREAWETGHREYRRSVLLIQ
jgi:hypothetical protein